MVEATAVMQYFANGVIFGAVLALAAIGLSLVYGILNISNFAHGDFLTMGAFATLLFATLPFVDERATVHATLATVAIVVGLALLAAAAVDRFATKRLANGEQAALAGFGAATAVLGVYLRVTEPVGAISTNTVILVATLVAVAATCAVLVLLEFLVWRPLRRKRSTTLTLIIVSIGLALIIRHALQLYFGGGQVNFIRPTRPANAYFGVQIANAQILAFVVAVLVIVVMHLFLKYTKTGKAMRALADNAELARVTGIDVDRLIVHVWVITAVLVTIAGVLLSLVQNYTMNVLMGFTYLIAFFAAVILGGIGSAYGAMLGGFIVGIAMKTSALWLGTEYELASAFIILILVLVVRPQGILGGKV